MRRLEARAGSNLRVIRASLEQSAYSEVLRKCLPPAWRATYPGRIDIVGPLQLSCYHAVCTVGNCFAARVRFHVLDILI